MQSLRRLIDDLDVEIDQFTRLSRGRLAGDPGYTALQQIPGTGPILAAVFVAEFGDVTRFTTAPQLACWAGLTPKHHESDKTVHRGRITKQGSRLVRWAAVESAKSLGPTTLLGPTNDESRLPAGQEHRQGHQRGATRWSGGAERYEFYVACTTACSCPVNLTTRGAPDLWERRQTSARSCHPGERLERLQSMSSIRPSLWP